MRRFIKSLFEIKSILVGVAVVNYAFFYAKAIEEQRLCSGITCYCFSGSPWFIESVWSYLPLLLLIAALGLYFRIWWSLSFSVTSCLIAIYWSGASLMIQHGFVQWLTWMLYSPDFFFQFLFASFILLFGISTLSFERINKAK